MNEIGTFDILGPNMIGPSSSHTAGALRIAFIAGRMVEKAVAVKFELYGSFARTYHGHGTDRALVGGILGYHPDDERIRDSFDRAKEAGLDFEFIENFEEKDVYVEDLYERKEKIGTYQKKYVKERDVMVQTGSYEQKACSKYNYVIIDDRTDFTNKQQEHFVHVDPMWGITDEHVSKAINILNNE